MKRTNIHWSRVFRRSAALFLATIGVWAISMTAGSGAAADVVQSMGESAEVVSSLLRSELGRVKDEGELDGWVRLILGQSPLLQGNEETVAAHLKNPSGSSGNNLPAGGSSAQSDPLNPRKEDPEEEPQLPSLVTAPDSIVPRTLIPTSKDGYIFTDGIYIFNRTDLTFDAPSLYQASVPISMGDASAPQILIMHTHATEAYTPDGSDVYTPTDTSRTLNNDQNMVRVGTEMKAVFESMGLNVIHDETPHDYPAYKGAYTRSGDGIKQYLAQYPSIKIVLDVHRDALVGADGTVYKTLTTIDGTDVAQVELVLGSPKGGDHPNWQQNLTLAMKLQKSMNTLYPTLARPISISSPVYNQNLTNGSLLLEVGSHGNTLQESIAGARLFARAAGQVLLGLTG